MADLDITQPNKGLELKFRTIILTYLLSFRKSILLLFLVYLLNLKKDSEAFQKAQSVTKQHRFNVKSQLKDRKNAEKITDSQQNDNDSPYEKQLNEYIRVIILLIAMFGGKGRLKSLLATLVKAELTAVETAIKCDLLQPVYCYVRNQGYAITLSMKNNLLKRGVNEFKADSLFSDSVPMLSYTDELGEVPPVPLPTPLMPVDSKQTTDTINGIGRSIQDSVMASTDVIQQPPSIPDTTVPVNTGTAQQPYNRAGSGNTDGNYTATTGRRDTGRKNRHNTAWRGWRNTTYTAEVKRGAGRKTAKRALAFSEFRKETERNQHTGVHTCSQNDIQSHSTLSTVSCELDLRRPEQRLYPEPD